MIFIVGVGPGDLERVPEAVLGLLSDPDLRVVARTRHHPALAQLAQRRQVEFCDDLYEESETFEEVYEAIVSRVRRAGESADVAYAVPGSPLLGELAVRRLLASGDPITLVPGESFLDAVLAEVGYDPLDRGLQVLDGHRLPDPLVLDKPTVIGHLDRPEILADACAGVARVVVEGTTVQVLTGLGSGDSRVEVARPERVDPSLAGLRTSLFVDAEPAGLIGVVRTMRRLRAECPWDSEQTHATLAKNLVEECFELVDAISALDAREDPDWVGYAALEDELGDVLLQVLFHEAIAREAGIFDIDSVAGGLREKLVRRHPHVFGDVEVSSAAEVKRNWDRIKGEEFAAPGDSILDGVPEGMPSLHRAAKIQNRAAKVGFDWVDATEVLGKVREELDELSAAMTGAGDVAAELGDVLFSLINLTRHLGEDGELALRSATHRFEERFRRMEAEGPLEGLGLDELNHRWERAKNG